MHRRSGSSAADSASAPRRIAPPCGSEGVVLLLLLRRVRLLAALDPLAASRALSDWVRCDG